MRRHTLDVIHRGIDSAVLASVPQVLVPKLEEKVFLNKDESADVGPRFIEALAKRLEKPLPEDVKWLGGLALAGFIHLITFPRWGGAVLAGSEKKPDERPWRMEIVLASAPLIFGMLTALLYGDGPGSRDFLD